MKDGVTKAGRRDLKRRPPMRLHGKTSTRLAQQMLARPARKGDRK